MSVLEEGASHFLFLGSRVGDSLLLQYTVSSASDRVSNQNSMHQTKTA